MELIFLGTPTFAVPTLERIVGAGHRVLAVFTQPDRPRGRGGKVTRIAGEGSRAAPWVAGTSAGAHPTSGSGGAVETDAAGRDGGGGLRADHSASDHRYSAARHHQRARVAAAEISRRGADPVGHREWRDTHRRDDHADRCRAGYRRHAAEVGDRNRTGRETRWSLGLAWPSGRGASGGDVARQSRAGEARSCRSHAMRRS